MINFTTGMDCPKTGRAPPILKPYSFVSPIYFSSYSSGRGPYLNKMKPITTPTTAPTHCETYFSRSPSHKKFVPIKVITPQKSQFPQVSRGNFISSLLFKSYLTQLDMPWVLLRNMFKWSSTTLILCHHSIDIC